MYISIHVYIYNYSIYTYISFNRFRSITTCRLDTFLSWNTGCRSHLWKHGQGHLRQRQKPRSKVLGVFTESDVDVFGVRTMEKSSMTKNRGKKKTANDAAKPIV